MKDEPKGIIGADGPQCRGAVGTPKPQPPQPVLDEKGRRMLAMADNDPLVAQILYDLQSKDIGWALDRLKRGLMVRRRAWPQGMRLQTDATDALTMHVILRTPTGPEVPWVCSLEDLRAEDWQ